MKIKPHKWIDKAGHLVRSDFFPFIDNKPRYDLNNCENCIFYLGAGEKCQKAWQIPDVGDDKLYLFCGDICGYFQLKHKKEE